jgi:hypothetical protein
MGKKKRKIFLKMDWNLEPAKKLFHLNIPPPPPKKGALLS